MEILQYPSPATPTKPCNAHQAAPTEPVVKNFETHHCPRPLPTLLPIPTVQTAGGEDRDCCSPPPVGVPGQSPADPTPQGRRCGSHAGGSPWAQRQSQAVGHNLLRRAWILQGEMDFVILFGLYLGLVLLSVAVCVSSRREQSFSWRLIRGTTQVFSYVIPAPVHRAAQKAIHGLFHSRNSFFVVLHLILEGLVYGEYTWEVFSYCQELQFSRLVLLLPYLLLAVNAAFFIVCSRSNPGIITKSNQLLFLHAYAYDGLMFQQDAECPTCAVRKPARSRHCGVCRGCVHRFDHHCVWVNNCIGAFNIRFFLCYLLTLTSMTASIAAVTAGLLIQVVLLSNLTWGHYTDDQGQEHPVDTFFLIQQLFLTFPRIVFMLGFVILLLVILGSYFCFILYLVLTNQTSNEWLKSARYTPSCSEPYSRQEGYRNIYSKGVWANLAEIVTPLTTVKKRK